MALTKTVTLINNFGEQSEFPEAYLRVDRVEMTKTTGTAHVGYYKEGGQGFLTSASFPFIPDLEGDNSIKQAYDQLKTLPEFADAVDC